MAALLNGGSLAELYTRCVKMANENKISAKNAFDLRLIEHLDDVVDSFMGGRKRKAGDDPATPSTSPGSDRSSEPFSSPASSDASASPAAPRRRAEEQEDDEEGGEPGFHEVSCSIEASARIYACRVDCVHTHAFRILGGLGCTLADEDAEQGNEQRGGDERDGQAAPKRRRICGVNTLERHEANITQRPSEPGGQGDPTFLNMAAAFDAGGARGLLLTQLPVAEDLSLVFFGDAPLGRAAEVAAPLFAQAAEATAPVSRLGLGAQPSDAIAELAAAELCPPSLEFFRRSLWGELDGTAALGEELEALLDPGGRVPTLPLDGIDSFLPLPPLEASEPAEPQFGLESAAGEQSDLPLVLRDEAEDALAFDKLLGAFVEGGGSHPFAYVDECWGKMPAESWARGAALDTQHLGALTDAEALPAALPELPERKSEGQEAQRRASKRPLFDPSGLEPPPARPLDTEPIGKHILGPTTVQRHLQKEVPPYMIDRTTMPSWQPPACDFARLGLRPHLMLKLMRKTLDEDGGQRGFFDLFYTDVVQNPEAPLWSGGAGAFSGFLASWEAAGELPAIEGEGGDYGDEDSDETPVDPQDDLPFVGPGDDLDAPLRRRLLFEAGDDDWRKALGPGGAKFVDVKLVKQHLWDCIAEDGEGSGAPSDAGRRRRPRRPASSFQGLVDRTVERMPQEAAEHLSVAVCFICALQLCNERGLELEADEDRPLCDFSIVGPA